MTEEKRIPNAFLDDIAKLAAGAAGLAQGARQEAEVLIKSRIERFAASRDWVSREEFDAVREMAILALDENKKLVARIEALEAKASSTG
ncbi:MAG: accessory factor UbiK family protein [Neomegalonema sp.]|nr:accessory factor UbiK family protein [Neomegalonema sp.]